MDEQGRKDRALALVLAGGKGSRLDILTDMRVKPAIPFAGSFRLIDIPLSNLVHSGFSDVWIIEQYRPHALNEQLANGRPWDLDRTQGGLRVLPPYQRGDGGNDGFARGNADAIHQHLDLIKEFNPGTLLVLSSDHIYKMDLEAVVRHHLETGSDATLVTNRATRKHATRFGVLESDDDGRVRKFHYKPEEPATDIVTTEIFVFRAEPFFQTMDHLAEKGELEDYGHGMIPHMVERFSVSEYRYDGYWRDAGTIGSYWEVHMDLLEDPPKFSIDDLSWPLLTREPQRPPARFYESARLGHSMIAPGCQIRGKVLRSVLSPGVVVAPGAEVRDSVVFEDVRIERDAWVSGAVVDRDVRIGEGAHVGGGAVEDDHGKITLVGMGVRIPAGARISPGDRIQKEKESS